MSYGLVANSTQYPSSKFSKDGVHLYHETLPPLIVRNAEDEAAALKLGYTETYLAKEYPKDVVNADGDSVTAYSPEHEQAILAAPPTAKKEVI